MKEALASYRGPACAVSVTIPALKNTYAPNEDVALLWGVQIDKDSSNEMDVPLPPDLMPTLTVDNLNQDVQILATYVRTCASPLECAPTLLNNDTFTTAQSGNFSSTGATYFQSLEALSFTEAGNYTVAAVAVLGNVENSTLLYFFQTTKEIFVKQLEVKKPEYNQPTTYCRVTEQDPLDDLLDASMIRASSDSCEIELAIETTDVVQVGQPVDIVWTATLTRNTFKEIQLPSPLVAVDIAGVNDSVGDSSYYTIVSSVVKLCERNMECNEYSSTVTVSSSDFSANFTSASTATFNASRVVIPSSGCVLGFAIVRRRQRQRETAARKERSHAIFGFRPLSYTNEIPTNSAHGSDESGHFMYVKAQISPMDVQRAGSLSGNVRGSSRSDRFEKCGKPAMMASAQDVAMGDESKHEDMEASDRVPPMSAGFMTPRRRRQQQASDSYEFSVTPEPSRRRLSTQSNRKPDRELQESPARYSPSKVKAAVRSFADFLHFLEQEEHHQEHELMPVIIQRFAELGAVIESQKRHIDRWKGKELDLAIEEAQQNLELIRELGETIQKQELQLASAQVEKQSWEEKYHLAAQEVESLKKQGTYQIQQLNAEIALLRQAGSDLEKQMKQRDVTIETMRKNNESLKPQLEQMDRDSAKVLQENTSLRQKWTHQSDEMHTLEQQIIELREHCETENSRTTELQQAVATWQTKYEDKERQTRELENALNLCRKEVVEHEATWKAKYDEQVHRIRELEDALNHDREKIGAHEATWQAKYSHQERKSRELENALNHGREEFGMLEGNLENKYKEHMAKMMQEHEQRLAQQHKQSNEIEAERQRLAKALQEESKRYQDLKKEGGVMRAQIEAEAMSAMTQREQQLLGEKTRMKEVLNHELDRIKQESDELRVKVDSLKDVNRRKSTEIGRLMTDVQELQLRQPQGVDTQRVQQITGELEGAKQYIEKLTKDLADKEAAQEEALKAQSTEFETQYTEFVTQVEGQFNELTQENEQLRKSLEETEKKLDTHAGQVSADVESELGKWRTECEKLGHQLHEGGREHESLKRELEHRIQELELKKKEIMDLNGQIEQFFSPNNERTREVELLHGERVRLEEQNQELQRQIEATRAEADAKMDEARQIIIHSGEQESAHQNAVRSLGIEKEDMNRALMTLSSEKAALDFQITSVHSEIEHWKVTAQQLEKDKQELELKIQELMRQATQHIETHKQAAAIATEDGRTQLQKLTAQLVQRDTQMNEGQQQLLGLQGTVRSLEDKLRGQHREFENLQMTNEQMAVQLESLHNEKRGLENIMEHLSGSILRESHRSVEGDLSQRLERLKHEIEQRVLEESEKSNRLQAVLELKLDAQQQHLNDENRKLEEAKLDLEQKVEELATECEKLDSELSLLHNEREEQDHALADMHQTVATLEKKLTQDNAAGESKQPEAAHDTLKEAHEQYEKDVMAQLKVKSDEVTDLQDDAAELQAKLDQEKEMTRHLMDRAHVDKQEHADELSKKTQLLEEQNTRVAQLETSLRQLQRKAQVNEESVVGKQQSVMHEKLQKEREYRSLQAQYDNLAAENTDLQKKMRDKAEEIEHLNDEIEQLHQEIRSNTTEMDNARGHLHISEQLTMKLEELQEQLDAQSDDVHQRDIELAAKETELQRVQDAGHEAKRRFQEKLDEKENELASLKQKNLEYREQLKRTDQHQNSRHKLEELQEELFARDDEVHQRNIKLAAKETELQRVQDAGHEAKRRFQEKLDEKENELASLKQKNLEYREQLKRTDQHQNSRHKLEELQEELFARDDEVHQRNIKLAAKETELQRVQDAGHEAKRRFQEKLDEKENELASLKQKNLEYREQLKRTDQRQNSQPKHSSNVEDMPRTISEETHKGSQKREQELTAQILLLEDEKLAMLNQFRREMRKLNIEFGAQDSYANGNFVDDSAFHHGIMEISALLRSYQDRETRQDALIHRKEKQISDLKIRLNELEDSFRTHDVKPNKHERQQSRANEESFQKQIDAMGDEVSKLRLENQELHENPTPNGSGESGIEEVREWEQRCVKLKLRVRELKEANAKLKDSRFSKADVKALVDEVEKLTSQLLEKDLQLQALRKHTSPKFKNNSSSATGAKSRRSKDLVVSLQQKEDKIMVLNDHLTELMTHNMRLQHETERYVVQYGPLSGTTAANGVIGNSGIRVPTRTNGSNQQPPAVRSK
ncbi:hypothetical protein BBO99_00004546 [Phytophthora kernoviae]|uniref:Uncharacterized protein n=1 Tax=Phytophthora kernoviae TaxID=325452 RepID=A0A3R7GXF1_9STRA|nr:hypothetical protein JM16_004326 [Phytophthora kernoviae]RLM96129.1 hypothetical protein BBI17_004672 [Phytophthora kernoviae]RLN80374.1 hypothetical protein BBO99_00004546 [Phytophthora kernoviae]